MSDREEAENRIMKKLLDDARAKLTAAKDENTELARKLREMEAENEAGNVALDFVVQFREAVVNERKSVCYWCGYGATTPDELKNHALECDKHPFMAELTSLRKKGEWIPFSPDDKETWPEANHWYWVCMDLSQAEGYFFLGSWKVNGEIVDDVIAYQPLPPPPDQLQGKKE